MYNLVAYTFRIEQRKCHENSTGNNKPKNHSNINVCQQLRNPEK